MAVDRVMRTGALALIVMLGVAGCESPSATGSAQGEGRTRLSMNNSFGEFGSYVVHVNAMSTANLTPEIAESYGIARSASSWLINVVVLTKSDSPGLNQATKARVEASAANLTGQVKAFELEEIIEGPSIYYIGTVSVDDLETLNVDLDIVPEGSNRNLPIRFTHNFYVP